VCLSVYVVDFNIVVPNTGQYIIKTNCVFVGVMISILWKNARSNKYQPSLKVNSQSFSQEIPRV
jgi:hypothetical protein